MSKPVVLIAEELSPATIEATGRTLISDIATAPTAMFLPAIADVDAILVRSATQVDAEALAAAKNLRSLPALALDSTTSMLMPRRNPVSWWSTPDVEHCVRRGTAVALLLASARNVSPAHAALRNGEWKRSQVLRC